MKRTYVYREGKGIVEVTGKRDIRHPDAWARLANEGTAGERTMEGLKQWESENGLKGLQYSPETFKRVWARDLPSNYGSLEQFRAYQQKIR